MTLYWRYLRVFFHPVATSSKENYCRLVSTLGVLDDGPKKNAVGDFISRRIPVEDPEIQEEPLQVRKTSREKQTLIVSKVSMFNAKQILHKLHCHINLIFI